MWDRGRVASTRYILVPNNEALYHDHTGLTDRTSRRNLSPGGRQGNAPLASGRNGRRSSGCIEQQKGSSGVIVGMLKT